jgi:hypothetical protein
MAAGQQKPGQVIRRREIKAKRWPDADNHPEIETALRLSPLRSP